MPTEVGIHVYLRVSLNRRGWRAFARHDDEEWAVSQSLRWPVLWRDLPLAPRRVPATETGNSMPVGKDL
jgi:hypothetical protein